MTGFRSWSARASDGWFLLADTDGDGTLANQRPVHDYLEAHETFGWSARGRQTPMTIAVNLAGAPGGPPTLDLFFDGDGHGSHVAGIAAGHDLYGVSGFDGVAPGAQILGLKIARDALGGISVTGSMFRGDGVRHPLCQGARPPAGHEHELRRRQRDWRARPGSTPSWTPSWPPIPGSSSPSPPATTARASPRLGSPARPPAPSRSVPPIPRAFLPEPPVGTFLAYFSSRGGELAKPDLVTPGFAYSTVPRWDIGDEQKEGTSMAAPYAAGLAARLVSGLAQEHRPVEGRMVKQALMVTARPLAGQGYVDQGTGLPVIGAAWVWIRAGHTTPEVLVRAEGQGASASIRWNGLVHPADSTQVFTLQAPGLDSAATFSLKTDAPWLMVPSDRAGRPHTGGADPELPPRRAAGTRRLFRRRHRLDQRHAGGSRLPPGQHRRRAAAGRRLLAGSDCRSRRPASAGSSSLPIPRGHSSSPAGHRRVADRRCWPSSRSRAASRSARTGPSSSRPAIPPPGSRSTGATW